ncbi:MAG TPA: hypothetical protein VN616_07300 [Puia sp.]|nr:hypothetical protein [Puia sp.]
MKRIPLTGVLTGALVALFMAVQPCTARGQTVAAMAEQLVQLKLLEQTTADGYRLMTGGLDSIGGITGNEYRLHADYFTSLAVIKPALNNGAVLVTLRALQANLTQQLEARLSWWRQQEPIDNLNN